VLRLAAARLEEEHGPGTVPSAATAYRHLARVAKGTDAVKGSAKARRSIAARPKGTYGRLRAARPGEYVVLDTQNLDVFPVEPVTCRWTQVQLTVAQDLFTRDESSCSVMSRDSSHRLIIMSSELGKHFR
jgi:putative transposase